MYLPFYSPGPFLCLWSCSFRWFLWILFFLLLHKRFFSYVHKLLCLTISSTLACPNKKQTKWQGRIKPQQTFPLLWSIFSHDFPSLSQTLRPLFTIKKHLKMTNIRLLKLKSSICIITRMGLHYITEIRLSSN